MMNQILFLSGVMLTIGLKSSMQFFMKRSNFKVSFVLHFYLQLARLFQFLFTTLCLVMFVQGTISFGSGFFLLVVGWPIVGMILEAYGFIVLFRLTPCTSMIVLSSAYITYVQVADWIFCAVAFGQHWQFFCRKYLS